MSTKLSYKMLIYSTGAIGLSYVDTKTSIIPKQNIIAFGVFQTLFEKIRVYFKGGALSYLTPDFIENFIPYIYGISTQTLFNLINYQSFFTIICDIVLTIGSQFAGNMVNE